MSEVNEMWLLGIERGQIAERERIIELLKDSNSVMGDWAIALIKEEQK